MLKQEWSNKFIAAFGDDPVTMIKAPGRINVIGEHTDYNLGYVLPAAINRFMVFCLSENALTEHHIVASDQGEEIFICTKINSISAEPTWMRYMQSILIQLNLRGHESKAVNCIFGGDIPQGGGMSSSAALCCGFIFGLSEINDWKLTRKQIAIIAQAAEHAIGINCGIMDQYATLFGKKDEVMLLDCRNLATSHFPMNLGPYAMFLVNSMQTHEFATESEYNDRRHSCESVVSILQENYPEIKALRDVNLEMLQSHKEKLDAVSYNRALYVIQENQRVLELVGALKDNKLEAMGHILREAQQGMKNLYEITTPEIDFLAHFVNNYPGALGARMMGGGFGGCTINFVLADLVGNCTEELLKAYYDKFGRKAEIYLLDFEDGINVF